MFDSDILRLACYRVLDWFRANGGCVSNLNATIETIERELERDILGIEHFGNRHRQNLKGKAPQLAFGDLQETFALFRIGLLLDEQCQRTVAFMNCFGPM